MDEHFEEDEIFLGPEDEFETGDNILMQNENGLEIGVLLGFSEHGVIWRRTTKKARTGPNPEDWEYVSLQRSVLTFTPWRLIDRLESHDEVAEEFEIGKFSELMDEVDDAGDFIAVAQAASEDDAEE
jgi:hypothetical protein